MENGRKIRDKYMDNIFEKKVKHIDISVNEKLNTTLAKYEDGLTMSVM